MAEGKKIFSPLYTALLINKSEGEINLDLVIDYAKQGIPQNDQYSRLILWEVLLHLLPLDRSKWEAAISARRNLYWSWVDQKFKTLPIPWLETEFDSETKVKQFGLDDDSVMSLIYGDISRTPSKSFYDLQLVTDDSQIREQMRRIERILYIFSAFNAAYSYTQGFNELAFPIYYVSVRAIRSIGLPDDEAEFHAFFLLQNLITGTGLGDLFTMDQDFESVVSKFDIIPQMLKIVDLDLHNHLFNSVHASPIQFAFSWVSVLFSQIFEIEPLLFLWDRFLLKKNHILEYGMAIATAHLISGKEQIMNCNFAEIMACLQGFHDFDVGIIITRAEDIWSQYIGNTH